MLLMAQPENKMVRFDYYGDTLQFPLHASAQVPFVRPLSAQAVQWFHTKMSAASYQPMIDSLLAYRQRYQLNDWLYYQLIRRTAQQIAPKQENYYRYTLYKWFLLTRSGFDATLNMYQQQLLFYVYSQDSIADVPCYNFQGKQYVCLNIHDYASVDDGQTPITPIALPIAGAVRPFSYAVTRLPEFRSNHYREKNVQFDYKNQTYHFRLKVNPEVGSIFTNYPGVDYGTYFNIPLSNETYKSLIPWLRRQLKNMKAAKGVDYLMNFTRNAFLYENDQANFGKEKRMGPEETLLNERSDCDDRAALFFFLVKELYNLPMIALGYPSHLTIAVLFDKPIGQTISFNGRQYSICEPTPQGNMALRVGQMAPQLKHQPFEVVYVYNPQH